MGKHSYFPKNFIVRATNRSANGFNRGPQGPCWSYSANRVCVKHGHMVPSPKYESVLFQLWGGTFRPKIASFHLKKMTNSPKLAQYDSDRLGPENWFLSGVSFLLNLIRGILSEMYGLFQRFFKGNSTYCPAEGSPLSLAGLANPVRGECTP